MNWRGIFHLGTRYLRRNRTKTILLIAAFTLVWLLPCVVGLLVNAAEKHLRSRAEATPLLIGRPGSPLELTFNGLYFTKPEVTPFSQGEAQNHGVDGISVIPLYSRYSAQDYRIVGTTFDYFRFRNFSFTSGRGFIRIGECAIGSKVAENLDLKVGDSLVSSPGSMFDIAGVYPLKMTICGIIKQSGTPDDSAVFVDLKTTWIIEGLYHGHDDVESLDADKILPGDDDKAISLNASVPHYNEVTPENAHDFHPHGDPDEFPITSAIAIPQTAKSQALLKGKYQARTDMQIISPTEEMNELFDTVFSIQRVVTGILFMIGIATVAIGFLVFSLSNRLRIREFSHLSNMGADPMFLRWLTGFEALFVVSTSLLAAGGILLIIKLMTPLLIKTFLS